VNSFFLFNGKNSVLWLLAIQIFLTIESLITQGIELAHIISIFIAFIIVFLFFKQSNRELHIIKSMFKLANSIEKGKLEYRITHIDPKSELGPIAWNC
jgi:signal transduction histidine kinase